jgi:hypothetical protein
VFIQEGEAQPSTLWHWEVVRPFALPESSSGSMSPASTLNTRSWSMVIAWFRQLRPKTSLELKAARADRRFQPTRFPVLHFLLFVFFISDI